MDARDDHLQCLAGNPNVHILPSDYEPVVSDVSETAAVRRMHSRVAGAAYDWAEERGLGFFSSLFFNLNKLIRTVVPSLTGLVVKSKEHFWSHVAEYPTHHSHLPPNAKNNDYPSYLKCLCFSIVDRIWEDPGRIWERRAPLTPDALHRLTKINNVAWCVCLVPAESSVEYVKVCSSFYAFNMLNTQVVA